MTWLSVTTFSYRCSVCGSQSVSRICCPLSEATAAFQESFGPRSERSSIQLTTSSWQQLLLIKESLPFSTFKNIDSPSPKRCTLRLFLVSSGEAETTDNHIQGTAAVYQTKNRCTRCDVSRESTHFIAEGVCDGHYRETWGPSLTLPQKKSKKSIQSLAWR